MEIKVPALIPGKEETISFNRKSSTLTTKPPEHGLRNLAVAIIQLAVSDLCSKPKDKIDRENKKDAREFLLQSEGFIYWCHHANIDSTWFREQLAPIIRSPKKMKRLREKLSRMQLIRGDR